MILEQVDMNRDGDQCSVRTSTRTSRNQGNREILQADLNITGNIILRESRREPKHVHVCVWAKIQSPWTPQDENISIIPAAPEWTASNCSSVSR